MNAGLYVAESASGWIPGGARVWMYCTGVRPSMSLDLVEARLAEYSRGRGGRYRVAVYVRDDERTRVVSPPEAVCKRKRGHR